MTTSLARAPQPWDVWLAYVRFADHPNTGKVRPVVALDNGVVAVVVAKITTAPPQPQYEYCELDDWEEEGLLKPSRVQTAPLFRVAPGDLFNEKPLGTLSVRDRLRLNQILQEQSSRTAAMNIDLVAKLKDFDAFIQAYEAGCERRIYDGKSLLFYSLANNDPESRYQISSFLLDKGTDATGTNAEGESVLHILLSRVKHNLGQTTELCTRLIETGANIEQLDNKGRSCLQYVVMSNFPEDDLVPLYDLLLVEGSKLSHTPNAWGKTPVDLAKAKGTRQKFLARVGATP